MAAAGAAVRLAKRASVEMDFRLAPEAPQRILVVDDDRNLGALLHRILEPAFEVTTVADAESALLLVALEPAYDLMLSDYMLPGLSGLELLQRVRRDKLVGNTKIIMISGHPADVVADLARAAGADAFLGKPFTPAQLRATVAALLSPPLRSGADRSGHSRTASLSD